MACLLALPVSFLARLGALPFSARVRGRVRRHPLLHALWFLAAAAVFLLFWATGSDQPKSNRSSNQDSGATSDPARPCGTARCPGLAPDQAETPPARRHAGINAETQEALNCAGWRNRGRSRRTISSGISPGQDEHAVKHYRARQAAQAHFNMNKAPGKTNSRHPRSTWRVN